MLQFQEERRLYAKSARFYRAFLSTFFGYSTLVTLAGVTAVWALPIYEKAIILLFQAVVGLLLLALSVWQTLKMPLERRRMWHEGSMRALCYLCCALAEILVAAWLFVAPLNWWFLAFVVASFGHAAAVAWVRTTKLNV